MPKVIEQYAGQHGCRTYIVEEQRVCMVPETKVINGRKYCDKHAPMSEHTKGTATARPWSIRKDGRFAPVIVGADQRRIVGDVLYDAPDPQDEETMANAELIVQAVNAHAELLSALERTLINFKMLLALKPVRDASETIAEAEAALRKAGAL